MQQAAFFVLPSYREGTPKTVLEAMASGRAVITSDAPGCREAVEHEKSGLLVPVRDVCALAAAMRRFIEEPELPQALAEGAYQRVCQLYDVRQVNESILKGMGL